MRITVFNKVGQIIGAGKLGEPIKSTSDKFQFAAYIAVDFDDEDLPEPIIVECGPVGSEGGIWMTTQDVSPGDTMIFNDIRPLIRAT